MKKSFYIALFSALLTAGLIKAAPALAETPVQSADVVVSLVRTSDLNLSTVDGQRQLDRRIANAAREVCGQASDVDLGGKNDTRECRKDTIARAQVQKSSVLAAASAHPGAVIAVSASR
ncbi:MAG TPA: UrcA family protein [Sphingomicrobium sp.]